MMQRVSAVIDPSTGKPFVHRNGHARPALIEAMLANQPRRANASYDATRNTEEYRRHWTNADAFNSDTANSREVRHRAMHRSRYEAGSNGYYDGILETHANMVVGVGPTLRMLTKNRDFNQFVEREFYSFMQRIQLRRKLWCMAHARTQDGEAFAMLLTNPAFEDVQLDMLLMEGEQCQTPMLPFADNGYIDGIKFDENNNILWYDVLPEHPGANNQLLNNFTPLRVDPRDMLHWFKMKRPGSHRSVPAMISTLNLGAAARRLREATLGKAEIQADFSILWKSLYPPETDNLDPVIAMSTVPIEKRMMVALPNSVDPVQITSDTPGANYAEFNRLNISEQARPLSMPYNAAACDSSTYSFASGKLDTLCYRAAIDVERQDCNDLVLDPLFGAWFREWNIRAERFGGPPTHQWDWPVHPVIDAVAEASATDMKLKNGSTTLRQVYSDNGQDLEDQLAVMAEDYFGEASEENVMQMRQILLRTHYPAAAPAESAPANRPSLSSLSQVDLRSLKRQLEEVEAL